MTSALHAKYVPILCFARGEEFYPMSVADFGSYCSLWARGDDSPLLAQGRVTPELLARTRQEHRDIYLQSVPAALGRQNVTARWSSDVVDSLTGLATRVNNWQLEVAQIAYRWLSSKTQQATRLFWWNDLVMDLVSGGKVSGKDLPRLDLPPEIRQAALENYQASQPRRPRYTYYYRTTRDGEYLGLQYWFFYGYNDWATRYGGMNDHEGDWEGIYLFFRLDAAGNPVEPPAYVTYVGHHSRLTKPWHHRDVTLAGTHPVCYIAGGSHATYPERREYELMKIYDLVDYATGDGLTIEPGDWAEAIDLDKQPWTMSFLGGWGTRYWLPMSWARRALSIVQTGMDEIGLPGVSAPRGPRYADDGQVRPNWVSAVSWAGILDLTQE